jgi:hypothetical protein
MNNPTVRFTKFHGAGVAKSYSIIDGALQKNPAPNFSVGTFETNSINGVEPLREFIEALQPGDFLTAGVHATLLSGQCGPGASDIHRKKETFPFASGEPGLLIIDGDNLDKMGLAGIKQFASALGELVGDADFVLSPSASAGITYKGVEAPSKGIHAFLLIEDAATIPAALEALHKRSVLLRYAWPLITADGKILIRSIVDTAMKSPNQPCFEGGAILGTGITQTRRIKATKALDSMMFVKVEPITAEEDVAFNLAEKALIATVATEAAQVRAAWRFERHSKMVSKGCLPENADRILDAALSGNYTVLSGDFEIQTDHHGVVTVREIMADKVKYHEATCRDPLDPEYGSGKAKIYSNNSAGSPAIHSFAHGEKTYILEVELFATRSKPSQLQNQAITLAGAALDLVDRTDAGNVAVLQQITNGDLRYILERKSFMVWSDGRWQIDHGSQITHQQALRVAEEYKRHAEKIRADAQQPHISDKERKHLETTAKSLEHWSRQCRNKNRIDAMLGLVQRDTRFVIQASELDRDPLLLGVANGTVNFRAGQLQPNSRADFVTKRCPVAFNRGGPAKPDRGISEVLL